jgi:hypothetical protein
MLMIGATGIAAKLSAASKAHLRASPHGARVAAGHTPAPLWIRQVDMPDPVFESELWLRRFPARLSRVRQQLYILEGLQFVNACLRAVRCGAMRVVGAALAYRRSDDDEKRRVNGGLAVRNCITASARFISLHQGLKQ